MTFAAVLALGSAWLMGVLLVSLLWPGPRRWRADLGFILPLGLGLGLGVTSAIFFAASLASSQPVRLSLILEFSIAAGLAWLVGRRSRLATGTGKAGTPGHSWLVAFGATALGQAALVAAVTSWRAYVAEPHGGWDGWAIWNMHARFIFRGGENWTRLLQQPPVAWTHADYPLLIPASVARGWAFVGQDGAFVSGLLSGSFGLATVGLLVAAVGRLRQPLVGIVGGLVLLGTPFFVTFASNEHADIPLGFFLLATVVLMALGQRQPEVRGFPVLAGLCAGLAAWTKNEGLLFALLAAGVFMAQAARRGARRASGAFILGLVVALVPVAIFKIFVAPHNDIVSAGIGGRLAQLVDGSRHRLILASLVRDVTRFGEWSVLPFFAMIPPLVVPGGKRLGRGEWWVAGLLALTGAGYYAVYLITPWDLAWHLDSSLVRLLLQLWPAAVFFWCLAISQDEEVSAARRRPRWFLPWFGVANLGLGAVVLTVLARQPAPNQLAVARVSGGEVSLLTGDGWFGCERDRRAEWMWSKGESVLFVRSAAAQPVALTLRFRIRGLGARTVRAFVGAGVVWQGAVGEALVPTEIAGVVWPPGVTAVVFKTDAPGLPESGSPNARALTFALYDPRLE